MNDDEFKFKQMNDSDFERRNITCNNDCLSYT